MGNGDCLPMVYGAVVGEPLWGAAAGGAFFSSGLRYLLQTVSIHLLQPMQYVRGWVSLCIQPSCGATLSS